MHQQWFSVVGLSIDIAGVIIILREWWLGHEQATNEAAQKRYADMAKSALTDVRGEKSLSVGKALEDIVVAGTQIRSLSYIRPILVKVGASAILFGFLLQLMGS
jgi:hypothetical protein